ncbi:hypothetical protein NLI96_g3110 [Meripilus lineatus]|uniref:F-box domain-containing protein n=1 Tax=Meripilus lineatus TaxID=2056292 RepID=A0AAD5V8Z3_9APHY|nr:hypothetical protein NLI96_g3110 [Physisporinus lineatus]
MRLPFELIVVISELLADDIHTLSKLGQACKSCRDASFRFLFNTITLRNHHTLENLSNRIFQNDRIRSSVRNLIVDFSVKDRPNASLCQPWFAHLPVFIRQNLPRLHSLQIIALGIFDQLDTPQFFPDLRSCTSVKCLTLRRCCIPYRALNGFVSNLVRLESLHVHDHWLDGEVDFNLSRIPPLSAKAIPPLKAFYYHNDRYSGPTTDAFVKWLFPVRDLTKLGLHVDREECLPGLGEFLRSLGKSLESLELRFLNRYDDWGRKEARPEDGEFSEL